jgi:hypothetical protein
MLAIYLEDDEVNFLLDFVKKEGSVAKNLALLLNQ